jgi:glycosyltransferase involved in cell wall biosynthesis
MTAGGDEPFPAGAPALSIVVPAHNEQDYLLGAVGRLLEGLRRREEPFEVVICENGSADRTAALAAGLADSEPEVRWLQLGRADYGLALRAGFVASVGELVVNFDVDLVDLSFLDQAVALARSAEDIAIVVGSKRGPGAEDGRALGRRAVTGVFSLLLRYGFGLRASDTHGLKLLRRAPLVPVVAACRSGSDIFDTELVLRAERAGLRVEEIPVRVVEQRPPRTPVTARIPRTLLGLVRLRSTLWRGSWSAAGQRSGSRSH